MPSASRMFVISRADAGQTLADWLRVRLSLPRPEVLRLVSGGRVRLAGTPCRDPQRRLRPGQRLDVRLATPVGPRRGDRKPTRRAETARPGEAPVVVYHDAQIVVVDKPPGLTTMRHAEEAAEFGVRGRRFLPTTLADVLPGLLPGRTTVRAVHRLDKETSGLVVFALTPDAEAHLNRQFREHTTERLYRALVRGRAQAGRIESLLGRDRGDGRRGSVAEGGQRAVTHVTVVEPLGDYTLVECRLETGRTHQVRIHLGEAGTPLCGERIYDRPPHGRPAADESGARRIALHAAVLGLTHPATGRRLRWESALPKDLRDVLGRLRRLRDEKQKEPGEP